LTIKIVKIETGNQFLRDQKGIFQIQTRITVQFHAHSRHPNPLKHIIPTRQKAIMNHPKSLS